MARTVPTGRGPEVVEVRPEKCVKGHPLRPPNVQVFSLPCSCSGPRGHRGWRCWTCGEILYAPPHTRGQGQRQGSAYD
jgi:hypothetical protein